jgi:hypothetical protein
MSSGVFGLFATSIGKLGIEDPWEGRCLLQFPVCTATDPFPELPVLDHLRRGMSEEKDHKVISPAWWPSGVRKSDV